MDIHQNSCSREKWSVLMYNFYSFSRHGRANYHGLVSLLHVFIKMRRSMVLVLSLNCYGTFQSVLYLLWESGQRKRKSKPLSNWRYCIYDALLLLINGDPLLPVKERSRAQKSAAIRLWRSKGQLNIRRANSKDGLFCNGSRILRSSQIKSPVAHEFHRTKGSGAKKLYAP